MSDSTVGVLACLATVLLWTIGTFSFARASRLASPSGVNRVRLLYALIVLSVITCSVERLWPWQLLTTLSAEQFLWFGSSGFIGFTLGDYLSFSAFKILGGRRATVFTSFAPAAALLAGIVLVDEHIGLVGVIGMAISIGGILMLSLSRSEQHAVQADGHGHFWHGALLAALGAACQGIGLVLSKKGFAASSETLNAFHATWIRLCAAVISAYAIGVVRTDVVRELRELTRNMQTFRPLLSGTIVGPVLGVSASLLAVSKIEASVAQTILALTPVSVTLAAALFFREKVKARSYLAVLICVIGVVVLVWRDRI